MVLMAALNCRYTPATETTWKLHIPLESATNRAEVDAAAAAAAGGNPIPAALLYGLQHVPLWSIRTGAIHSLAQRVRL